jgi:hypothetical protein
MNPESSTSPPVDPTRRSSVVAALGPGGSNGFEGHGRGCDSDCSGPSTVTATAVWAAGQFLR